jgi:branched-chain amino acid transport system permease protein
MSEPSILKRALRWLIPIAIALVLPFVFKQSFAISLFCQMGVAIIFALSYNMLLGQTGMLSFGHAVYFGLGAYFCAHALNLIAAKTFQYPVTLLPLIGGVTGLVFGLVFGYVTTQRSGTPFAMISLGIGEMVAAAALMFPFFFGGEEGVSANRSVGEKLFGISYGPQKQVYYLIAGWVLVATALMYAITKTPLGRMANAVRDNAERAQYVGYNPQRVRFFVFALASMFAGIAGGLAAINYEIVTAENLGLQFSGSVLLMAFIGGIGTFYGPIIGAIIVTFLQVALSGYTKAWLLYLGLFFLIMVMFAPGGIASLIELHRPAWRARLARRLLPSYAFAALSVLIALAGVVGLIEIIYFLETQAGAGSDMKLAGMRFDAAKVAPWIVCAVLIAIGAALFRPARNRIRAAWDGLAGELHAREAA